LFQIPIVVPISDPNIDLAFGLFQFVWKPNGTIREGDYYICYSYTPSYAKASLTKYLSFYVQSNIANDVANPAHITKPEKYSKTTAIVFARNVFHILYYRRHIL